MTFLFQNPVSQPGPGPRQPQKDYTPYSSIRPFFTQTDLATWAMPWERERLAAYQKYDELYWNTPGAMRRVVSVVTGEPIYVPTGQMLVDSVAHFWMKNFSVGPENGDLNSTPALKKWLKQSKYIHKFHVGKHSGVTQGDAVWHLYADPSYPAGSRVCFKGIDPGSFFPEYSDDDPDEVTAVNLVDAYYTNTGQVRLKVQRYQYIVVAGRKRVTSELVILQPNNWWIPDMRTITEIQQTAFLLPELISKIPVYHLQNREWTARPYGTSELAGYESMIAGISQSVSDEDIALALEGLGVFVTDAPPPTRKDQDSGEEVPIGWEIAPGVVNQIPEGKKFERVQGVGSVKPMQDHIGYLTDTAYETSGTFRPLAIDAMTAESGIALAIKFLPMQAKLDERDENGVAHVEEFFEDWKIFQKVYENETITQDIEVTLGDKLPGNSTQKLNELNNMHDRGIIDDQTYRDEMSKHFGYKFPPNIAARVTAQQEADIEMQRKKFNAQNALEGLDPTQSVQGKSDNSGQHDGSQGGANQSNNKNKPNESKGSEA